MDTIKTLNVKIDQLAKLLDQSNYQNKEFLNTAEAARFLGIGRDHLHKLTMRREITFTKPGGKLMYFRKLDLEKYMAQNPHPSRALLSDRFRQHEQ